MSQSVACGQWVQRYSQAGNVGRTVTRQHIFRFAGNDDKG
ncbi:hypothetical protein GFS60_00571 [Rhodococcus sp. WAY2]|nr:hypothetical protein GFS60_00571 [Rhodococcus sp. WAY2]